MMETPTIIYCGGGNKRFAQIAIANGFKYGCRFPDKVYGGREKLYFSDIDWKNPNKEKYIEFLSIWKPHIATVLDLERIEQYNEVLLWAEAVSEFVEIIVIIPKIHNIISKLPRLINNKEIRLGYSVPTRYGGTNVMLSEFQDRSVHLLGGAPHKQYELSYYLDVKSVNGNMILKMATQYCAFFDDKKTTFRGHWPNLKDIGLRHLHDAPYEAFNRSCQNILRMWSATETS